MRPVQLSQVAAWCEARLIGADGGIAAVSTDTRTLAPGSLYVALRGERFDGHDFCVEAAARGAAALLVDRRVEVALPQLVCDDTLRALGRLAAAVQAGRPAKVIAITGSNGKTSVKTLLHGILAQAGKAYANPGNRNNEIGLPLAVLDAPEDADYAIYEMGAGKPGDIAYLTGIARPHVSLVNNIAPAHLERMGTLLRVAETKGAIYEALPADGVAVINADDAFALYFVERAAGRRVLRFGLEGDAEVTAHDLLLGTDRSRFELVAPAGRCEVVLPLPGRHSVMNALAAAALALAAGASLEAVRAGLQEARPVPGRQTMHALSEHLVLIDDSYNANPGSVAAAIDTLAAAGDESWLVLGDMAELGEGAELLHADIGGRARRAGIARLFTVGALSRAASRAYGSGAMHFDDRNALVAALRMALEASAPGRRVRCLVKGSRSSAMDEVVASLLAAYRGEGAPREAPQEAPQEKGSGHAA
ncbi:MAG: UDP-N-acetylmuramoyl-tripeptide--D-alanyl-D-alanine ligase [Rehaibacterium terrae]|uniref:UDP-N-acetylmuramoyl-tripeptide--D-alanyl-D- alanine ligase n=1 Tax=Rehaibacterium terrae TaxID=1341696 RepID=UPI00391CAED4